MDISNYMGKLHRRLYKTRYYASRAYLNFLPYKWVARSFDDVLTEYRRLPENIQHNIARRVAYYNKLDGVHTLCGQSGGLDGLDFVGHFKNPHASAYFYDLADWLRYFPENTPFAYCFGDVIHIPNQPTLVKSRPIAGDNQNSVLLKLDSVRHFYVVADKQNFADKNSTVIWRGAAHQPHRLAFVEKFSHHPQCDIKCVHNKSLGKPYHGEFVSIKNQLKHKFIVSIEGNDVATNTKWIMASQSLCFMTTPKYETWLMEGLLQPDVHFVHLQDDYADLDEKIVFYNNNPKAAENIIHNANQYMQQFFNRKHELITSLLVLQKYFEKTRA